MVTGSLCPSTQHIELPCVNRVTWQQPLYWLRLGWGDFKACWLTSLAFGVLFSMIGFILFNLIRAYPHLVLTLSSGFLLVSPFLAVTFQELSRRGEQPESPPFASVRANLPSIGLFAFLLMFILSVWERFSAILVGLYLGSGHVQNASLSWLFSLANPEFVVMYLLAGATLAVVVFALSVVSLPMLVDRPADIITALMTSLLVVRENPLAMLVWALTIVLLTGIGIATALIGLAFIFPILGHATWHAYRDLVQR